MVPRPHLHNDDIVVPRPHLRNDDIVVLRPHLHDDDIVVITILCVTDEFLYFFNRCGSYLVLEEILFKNVTLIALLLLSDFSSS